MLLSMVEADALVAPTRWQAAQFPPELGAKLRVAHEGIDTREVAPDAHAFLELARQGITIRAGDEVVTFVNRNLEPYRSFHIFMRALPRILAERPRARAVIVGGTGVSYGPSPPSGRSWKSLVLDEVRAALPMDRVHFVGRVPRPVFRRLMQVSAAHVYLTYPFVLSWSMLEAMAAGAPVVASRRAPVEEVIEHRRNGLLVDFFDVDALAEAVVDVVARPRDYAQMRAAGRATVVGSYDVRDVCLAAWLRLIEEVMAAPARSREGGASRAA